MACREEEIPNVGDYHVYEIAGYSLLIVRSAPDEIKAHYNICLHRGRKLETTDGCKRRFRCAYHGWEWNPDGTFRHNPWGWDFPQLKPEDLTLPQAKVGRWGGFVFVSFRQGCAAARRSPRAHPRVLQGLPLRGPLYRRPCRQEVSVQLEGDGRGVHGEPSQHRHAPAVSCHGWPTFASGYDVFSDYTSRQLTAMAIPSSFIDSSGISQSEIFNQMMQSNGRLGTGMTAEVPEGMTARAYAAQEQRRQLNADDGYDYSRCSDAEMLDPMLYNVFPNMSFWAGYAPNITYRWRPDGVDSSIMDIYILKRVPKGAARPRPAPMHWLGDDEPFTSADELGALGGVFEQDMANLPFVQQGLKMMGKDIKVQFGVYTEMRLRQLHQTLRKHLDR